MNKIKIFEPGNGNFNKQIEHCYQLCTSAWDEIKAIANDHRFHSLEAEIEFYKILKPKFTSEIEYYRLVYHSILFKPEDDMTQKIFWKREQRRFEYFISEHKEFYHYYKSGLTDKDKEYFTRIDEDHIDF